MADYKEMALLLERRIDAAIVELGKVAAQVEGIQSGLMNARQEAEKQYVEGEEKLFPLENE